MLSLSFVPTTPALLPSWVCTCVCLCCVYVQMFVGPRVCAVYANVTLINISLTYWGRVSDSKQSSQIWPTWPASLFQGSHLCLLNLGITGRPPNPPSTCPKVQNPNSGPHTLTACSSPSEPSPHPVHPCNFLPWPRFPILSPVSHQFITPAPWYESSPSTDPSPQLPSTKCLFEW